VVGGELKHRIAWNLQLYRLVHDLTQEALAERLDLHPKYLGHIEQARRNLTLTSLERLAEGLDVDPVDLQQPIPSRP
jgi:transcriptional regulator with XRE-family HTH domain